MRTASPSNDALTVLWCGLTGATAVSLVYVAALAAALLLHVAARASTVLPELAEKPLIEFFAGLPVGSPLVLEEGLLIAAVIGFLGGVAVALRGGATPAE